MKNTTKVLAIDIGASSGRHIVGWREDGQIRTQEVYRFANGMKDYRDGHLVWSTGALYRAVVRGIKKALAVFPDIQSLSIDTWGCDYVLLRGEKPVSPCFAYRDARTADAITQVHETVPFKELFARTGTAFNSFNTVYQLYADKTAGRLKGVTDFLMMPEYLGYLLAGVKKKETTAASTTGLVSAATGEFDRELIGRLGLPAHLFGELCAPGTVLGPLKSEVAAEVGGNCRVLLCASHDTASAVEGIPMLGDAPYISSGTWSLLGVKQSAPRCDGDSLLSGYGNEGGVGYVRYQKNIMGMWIVGRLREELCPDTDFSALVDAARQSDCAETVNVNDPRFLAPASMKQAFDSALGRALQNTADYFCCAYHSLAACYASALTELERNVGKTYDRLYIVGGGAKNAFVNELTEKYTGKKVIALPIEATALGNLKIQLDSLR